jgi:hypothetical protein
LAGWQFAPVSSAIAEMSKTDCGETPSIDTRHPQCHDATER